MIECMFEESQTAARSILDGIVGSRRRENQSAAQLLVGIDDLFQLRMREYGECAQWAADTTEAVAGEVSAALNISAGLAADYVLHARCLREQLPTTGAVFAAGDIDYATFQLVVSRTALVDDDEVMAAVDAEVAAALLRWRSLSRGRLRARVDRIVARHDRDAVRRRQRKHRDRGIEIWNSGDGLAEIRGFLRNMDAHLLEQRPDGLAATVCGEDLRTLAQRRADAVGALAVGLDRLECGCERADCPAGTTPAPRPVVIHVVAGAATVEGQGTEAAVVVGADWLVPPEIVAELARTARLRPIIHPGDAAPECGYAPSRALADFVRCRDLTCRFPGCDRPATESDIDHTIPYDSGGHTHASNLKCLCRKQQLRKTLRWLARQCSRGRGVCWVSRPRRTDAIRRARP
ncbi:MAG: DUF222 domain-containing protein [Mycobacterium sp.]